MNILRFARVGESNPLFALDIPYSHRHSSEVMAKDSDAYGSCPCMNQALAASLNAGTNLKQFLGAARELENPKSRTHG